MYVTTLTPVAPAGSVVVCETPSAVSDCWADGRAVTMTTAVVGSSGDWEAAPVVDADREVVAEAAAELRLSEADAEDAEAEGSAAAEEEEEAAAEETSADSDTEADEAGADEESAATEVEEGAGAEAESDAELRKVRRWQGSDT